MQPGNRSTTTAALVPGAALAFFAVVAVLVGVDWAPLRDLDRSVDRSLTGGVAPGSGWVTWWKAVSTIGQPAVLEITAVVAGLALLFAGHRRAGVFAAVTVSGASLLNTVVKSIAERVRPGTDGLFVDARGSSFPSGHAMTSAAAALVLVLAVRSVRGRVGAPAALASAVVAGLVGFSRLALGVHYVTDVVAAWLLAIAWATGIAWLLLGSAVILPTRRWRGPPARSRPPRRRPC